MKLLHPPAYQVTRKQERMALHYKVFELVDQVKQVSVGKKKTQHKESWLIFINLKLPFSSRKTKASFSWKKMTMFYRFSGMAMDQLRMKGCKNVESKNTKKTL